MRLDLLNKLGPKGKIAVIGIIVILGGALVYENVALKGRQIFSQQIRMAGVQDLQLSITEVGVEHYVEVYSSKKLALRCRLNDPQGTEVYARVEVKRHSTRGFKFTPQVAGNYALRVEPGMMVSVGEGHGRVRVTIGDKRIITTLFHKFRF